MTISDDLERLQRLKETGVLSDDEFQQAKQRALAGESPSASTGSLLAGSVEARTREWALLLHLSQLLGLVLPLAGFLAPLLIWQLKKAELPAIDAHGKVVMNWILSALIYLLGASLLVLVFVGIPLLLALVVVAVVFPIIGAIKANAGELWRYPLSIAFLK
ncbi:DUF4870 domain-containing protein [uncultured Thiohalocapsa sp.]|uniref:DUF4870 domain-containing protein n=1 Tax=uncultured Thiohalocapsa sp. TaxID=768990 RepID=UPI0025DBC207|nr:DUF4870 domain-containing protein [uncultured Thiohalocapsa sp.]